MKKLIALTALVATPLLVAPVPHRAAPAASSASRPVFEFKGLKAGEVIDPTPVADCSPPQPTGEMKCDLKDSTIAGIRGLTSPTIYLYKGRLTSMVHLFNAEQFLTMLDAFTTKYGQPCSTAHPKWQNKMGATFDNTVVTWCFRTGKLEMSAMSIDRTYGDFSYTDVYKAPAKAATVDF